MAGTAVSSESGSTRRRLAKVRFESVALLVLASAIFAACACGARSGLTSMGEPAATFVNTDAGPARDATVGDTQADASAILDAGNVVDAGQRCVSQPCTSNDDCAADAPFCSISKEGSGSCNLTCGQTGDDIYCDVKLCGTLYAPRYRDGGTVYGDCKSGWCRCYILFNDWTRSAYLDEGRRPSCK